MQGDLPDEPFVFIGNEDAFRMTNVYYHIDTLPMRSPLILVKNEFTTDLKLKKFGKEVVILDKQDVQNSNKPYLEFTNIKVVQNIAYVEFIYPVEGIYGNVELELVNAKWLIKSKKIMER